MIRIGISGFGKIGKLRFDILKKIDDVEIVGLNDVVRPKSLSDNTKFFDSIDKLLEENLDAIFICAFNNFLVEYTIKSLKKGVHVFCENHLH